MSIINELYNGNINPGEKFAKKDGEYHKLMAKLSECIELLMPMLDGDSLKLWNEIQETELSMEKITERESFIDGFCIGAKLMQEILENDRIDRELP